MGYRMALSDIGPQPIPCIIVSHGSNLVLVLLDT